MNKIAMTPALLFYDARSNASRLCFHALSIHVGLCIFKIQEFYKSSSLDYVYSMHL